MQLDDQLGGIKHHFDFIEDDDKQHGIDEYLKTNNPDLLVMLKRKSGFFQSIFHKSITKKMALHGHTPLLVLHD